MTDAHNKHALYVPQDVLLLSSFVRDCKLYFQKITACVCCLCVYVCETTVKYYSHTSAETSSAFDQIVDYMTAVVCLVVSYSQTICLVAADTTLQWTFFSVKVSKYSQTRLLKGLDLLQLLTILAVFEMFICTSFQAHVKSGEGCVQIFQCSVVGAFEWWNCLRTFKYLHYSFQHY